MHGVLPMGSQSWLGASLMQVLQQSAATMWRELADRLAYVVIGLILILLSWLLGRLVRKLVCLAGQRTRLDIHLANLLGKLGAGITLLLGLLVASVVIFPGFRPADLITGLGVGSIAVGLAFRDTLQNFFAGILILWRKPFRIGDEIRHKEFEGSVEDINVRSTRVRTYDGELAVLPNAEVYGNAVLVRTAASCRRVRLEVGIGYPDSIEQARQIIHQLLAQTDGVRTEPSPWVYVSELAPSSVNFTVFFWTEPKQAQVLAVRDRVITGIKLALDAARIDIPYPHTVVLLQDSAAGRPGAGPAAKTAG